MTTTETLQPGFLQIGHRGTRGLMPENTIPSMQKAIELGANVIELDVHVSKDNKLIVYHDESFNPDYTTMPGGGEIPKQDRQKYTFYQMNYDVIRKFDVGSKPYPAYPQQQRMAIYAPLLSELIDSVEAFTKSRSLKPVYYLVEVKSKEKTDGVEQPAPETYMKLMMDVLDPYQLGERLIVQSFDMRPLQVLHRTHPRLTLGFLTGEKALTFEQNLAGLGFTPEYYNPHYSLVDAALIAKAHVKGIKVTPWTVNDLPEMKRLKSLKVDGIITDYPNLFKDLH
ncbi:glycerophosphodiester phosphodiesterase [Segetibacter sp. 3557_3]|uniref:glycerophosphodiester phosphodiesterase family protein n=1 Tax=Segetibacter sp. 3557_3 TaxID=2547429 RepID=UPI0010589603|nr:glycerophosphodiester phosphodiesterase family protein [Segetibacter sp. 3557_3]TDH28655.1 glycerophosphodiester phosphodiesterase [Segetibacter sp. 3557_3]